MPEESTLVRAANALRRFCGIDVPDYWLPILAAELDQLGGPGGHARGLELLLTREASAWDRVVDAMTVPETYFFRHFGHFVLLRHLAEARVARGLPTRVLCAGCSSGEEAWSAAAVLVAARGQASARDRVVAWDVSEKRLGEMRAGRYPKGSVRSGLHGYEAFFARTDDGWRIAPTLLPLVQPRNVNLVGALPRGEGPFDAIFFRNVGIYWNVETAHAVVEQLGALLAPEGVLLVGPGDPVGLDSARWEARISQGVRSYRAVDPQRRPAPARAPSGKPRTRSVSSMHLRAASPSSGEAAPAPPAAVPAYAERPTPVPPPLQAAGALAEVKTLADAGRYAAALEVLRATAGSSVDAKLWEGILLLALGDAWGAIEPLRQCVFLGPDRPSHRRWLAAAYRAVGRWEDARREQRNAQGMAE